MSGAQFNRGGSRQDYETPPDLITAVHSRFGVINYDLAADNWNTKGQVWIDKEKDSLSTVWKWHEFCGNLWLNPPYNDIAPWAAKCRAEAALGAKILFLVPASVGANWFQSSVFNAALVLFLSPRLKFVGAKDPYPRTAYWPVTITASALNAGAGNRLSG
jgi:phage N-6-adenine-methyltransferase